jgi:hypothetical protein
MSDWKSYLDHTCGEPIHLHWYRADEPLTELKLLRPGARECILKRPDAAARFLDLVANGELDFLRQQGLIHLLDDLFRQIHLKELANTPWGDLAPQLSQTLTILGEKIGPFMEADDPVFELNEDDLSYSYGFGQGAGCIHYGLPIARLVALRAFIEAYCRMHANATATQDLIGTWCLVITEPKIPEFAKVFKGTYGQASHARITKVPRHDIWHLSFLNFPPIGNWYSLEGAAYKAAAPVVAHVLCATVKAWGELSD